MEQSGPILKVPHRSPSSDDSSPRGSTSVQATTPHSSDDSRHQDGQSEASTSGAPDGGVSTTIALIATTMALGVANRVLYKMALVPLGDYVFFLAQFQTFGYVAVYFTALLVRYRSGIITKEMLQAPDRKLFLWIGGLEALSQLLGFIGASKLPGVVLPLLQQSLLIWQVTLAYLVLNKRLDSVQIAGALLVVAGVVTAAWPNQGASVFTEISPVYATVFVASMLFPALSTIFKEQIFTKAKETLKGKQLDIFVVNSFGSLAQAVVVFLLLPGLAALRGISFTELPQYLTEGFQCLTGTTPACATTDCGKAPVVALAYVVCNLGLNISALALLRKAGNVVQSLSFSSIVPLTIWAFTFDWPLLDPAPSLGSNFLLGTGILLGGLLTYNSKQWLPALQKRLNKEKAA
ncbi:g696 [Coccomyxa viridis]|uniref:G696 protein n=1 Tax=Coccomyxa viridis TaxID=1274662 RepID=A0ABP1FGC0_9CHLO